jgi:hypothetical protein
MKNNNLINVKILVCCHQKGYWKSDDAYIPVHVGKTLSNENLQIQGDDEGDNISTKNKSYCELTGLYWAWKNLKNVDYIGLCHYRRYFDFHNKISKYRTIDIEPFSKLQSLNLDLPEIKKLFNHSDIILAKPEIYKYSLAVDYSVCHISEDYRILKNLIAELTPEYNDAFVHIFDQNNKLSHYNMFLTTWEIFNEFSSWLFVILAEMEKKTDISLYNHRQYRVFGYMAERLLNVFVYKKQLRVKYYPIYWMLSENAKNAPIKKVLSARLKNKLSFFCQQDWI